ncbi:MAG: polysaccharide pyruvyl transferase family protein [Clostridia bacterium]|nr:polysaccharide pyruvyl transferase family protein [Clostridia bacterium]
MKKETDFLKKVKIITIHFGTNHGSVLQAYALSNYLKSVGCDAQIIDYIPDRYKIWNSLVSKKGGHYPLPVLMAYYPVAVLKSARIRKLFENFLNKNLNLTGRYASNDNLKKNPPEADAYISGSDQVWNNDYNGNNDFSYFLDFAPEKSKRIAYAASFGKENITEKDYISNIKPLLESFDAVSVRETDAQNILNELEIPSTHVVDPVFLLTKEQWKKFGNPVQTDKPYILVYVMDGLYSELLDYAQKLKEKTGNMIYVVSFKKIKDERIDKCFHFASPKDFIGLIENADAVVTNSFHGTAFSVLFQKKFISIGKEKYNSRMISLLEKLSLETHFVPTGSNLFEDVVEKTIQRDNIGSVDQKLGEWIKLSKEFLDNSLNIQS